jgi:hypothetical protein
VGRVGVEPTTKRCKSLLVIALAEWRSGRDSDPPKSQWNRQLIEPKGRGESPFDPYDPQILHQISHYLRTPKATSLPLWAVAVAVLSERTCAPRGERSVLLHRAESCF